MTNTPTRRDGRCFWLREALAEGETDAAPLTGATRADVAIVGGGFCGLWTALELKRRQPSLDVAIVEADICGGGASGRATGQVLPQWGKLGVLASLSGSEAAKRFCSASAAVVGELEQFCRSNGIDADIRLDPWLWAATSEQQLGAWQGIVDGLARHDLAPYRPVSRAEIEAITDMPGLLGGVVMDGTATLQPAKLVRGLRRVALEKGVRIYENSLMTGLGRAEPPIVRTARGSIEAERVVLAMNAWSLRFAELRPAVLVIASDDAISEPIPELLTACRYRAKPQITDSQVFVTGFRTTPDDRLSGGVTGGRIGFAGLGAARFEGRSAREDVFRAALARANPKLARVPFADSWYGPIDRTRSGLPLFGSFPGRRGVFYGYGFSGNGITTAPLAGRILASLVLDMKDEWSQCGLVRAPERWLPPEPIKYLGAHAVRHAIRRRDALGYRGRDVGAIGRWLAGMAPGGVVTTPED